ncbi:MAG TPA: DUF2299 family protein [Nitrososphaera sp.]|nr:DUF2299 family protein [Nitrososphaera sp.]
MVRRYEENCYKKMQADNTTNNTIPKNKDGENRLVRQRETIDKVVNWLREEEMNPEDKTALHEGANYFARILIKKDKLPEGGGEMIGEEEGFHVLFPKDKLDSVTISEVIALDRESQKSYDSLGATDQGILQQNRLYFDLQLALLQKNVSFVFEDNVRRLRTIEVYKRVFFDGLTKDKFFDTYTIIDSAIAIARIKLGQFKDEILLSNKAGNTEDNSDFK